MFDPIIFNPTVTVCVCVCACVTQCVPEPEVFEGLRKII